MSKLINGIASREDCNTISKNSFSSDLTKCPTKVQIINTDKLTIDHSELYSNNQLVKYSDLLKGYTIQTQWVDAGMGNWVNPQKNHVKLVISGAELPAVTDFDRLLNCNESFTNLSSLQTFNIPLPNVIEACNAFIGCTNLTDFNSDMPKLKNARVMFRGCENLLRFNSVLPNLEDGYGMFEGCKSLETFNVELPKLSTGRFMFNECSFLSRWAGILPELTDWTHMFQKCFSLKSVSLDVPKIIGTQSQYNDGPFIKCNSLTGATVLANELLYGHHLFSDLPNLINVTCEAPKMVVGDYMFFGNTNLTRVEFNFSSLESAMYMFGMCKSLTTVVVRGTLKCHFLNFTECKLLTVESLLSILHALIDLKGKPKQEIILGYENFVKLTKTQREIATKKGWVLS